MNPRIVVHFLKEVHLDKGISIDGNVGPVDIPVTGLHVILHFPAEVFCYIGDDGVLGG